MNRSRTFVVAAAGGLLSVVLGSGLLALTSDSTTSPNNDFRSGTYVPAAHDVRAATIDPTTDDCHAMTSLGDGPLPVVITGETIDLDGGSIDQSTDFCVRNDGTDPGQLRASLVVLAEQEETPCAPGEAEAGDIGCEGTAEGDLTPVVQWAFATHGTFTSSSCTGRGPADFDASNTGLIDPDLAPGETCRVYLALQISSTASDDAKLRAQTDRVHLDIVFTLEDAA